MLNKRSIIIITVTLKILPHKNALVTFESFYNSSQWKTNLNKFQTRKAKHIVISRLKLDSSYSSQGLNYDNNLNAAPESLSLGATLISNCQTTSNIYSHQITSYLNKNRLHNSINNWGVYDSFQLVAPSC